jgi:transposase
MPAETRMIQQAFRVALDPTPGQARDMASHAGARRYVANWTHARISAAAAARQAQKEAGEEPTVIIPGRFELGPEWTRFKNTATGCRNCRHLLVRNPDGVWADGRTGEIACGDDAGPHDPTPVACKRCHTVLHDGDEDSWLDGTDSAACEPHSPDSDDDPAHALCRSCGHVLQLAEDTWLDDAGSAACKLHEPHSEFLSWTSGVFIGTIQAAIRDVAGIAWPKFLSGKARRPRFKKKGKSRESFQLHGTTLRLEDAVHVTMPKIGTVAVMSDDSLHPAMKRSRSRSRPGQARHMGNRRQSRQLWRQVRQTPEKASELGQLLRKIREGAGLPAGQAVAVLNVHADTRAVATETAKATALLEAAAQEIEKAEAAGSDPETGKNQLLDRGRAHARYAQKKLDNAPKKKAARTDAWTLAKLQSLETTGVCTGLEQADVICAAYGVTGDDKTQVMQLAAQARILRATVSLGADGLWWCSISAEVPFPVRSALDQAGNMIPLPSRAQREGGVVGVDFGVRELATMSDGTAIENPHYLESSLAELRAAQKALSRTEQGSNRQAKTRQLIGLIHADIARQRYDGLQRATTDLVRRHDVIAIEGWNVQETVRYRSSGKVRPPRPGEPKVPASVRRSRNRALADAGIGMARQMIVYKGQRLGVTVMITAPGAATGRTCSIDGRARATPLPPYQELFFSDRCEHRLPRRENTAKALAGWAQQEMKHGPSPGGPAKSRRGSVRPAAGRDAGGRQRPLKRAASTRPRPG